MMHTQEADGQRGIPLLSMGLYPTIDDVAKLTTLLQQGGQHQGQQLLSATKLAEALYHTDARGLPSGHTNRFGEGRYHLSFWSVPYRTATGCFFQIPYMLGAGAILWCCCRTASRRFGSPMGMSSMWTRWCWRGRPSGPSPVRQGLRRTRRQCACHSRQAPCVPRCLGIPSTGPP